MQKLDRKSSINYKDKVVEAIEKLPDLPDNTWTTTDDELLRIYYKRKETKSLAKAMGKNTAALYKRAMYLNITRNAI